jgi:hypothetical protein
MNQDQLLNVIIPYRMQAADTLNLALRLLEMTWEDHPAPRLEIHVNGKLHIEGNPHAFTNPAIEAGLLHCRALLEFLGLTEKDDRIVNRKRRRDDVGIEHFSNAFGPLPMVSRDTALSHYEGDKKEAEKALATVFQTANKGIAHFTRDYVFEPKHANLIEIASRGVPSLVVNHLYTPLGVPAPEYKLPYRPREN